MDKKEFDEKKMEYIYGELSKEEEAAFKEELKRRPEDAIDVELHRRIIHQAKRDKQLEEIQNDPGYEWAMEEAKKDVKAHNRDKRRRYLRSKEFRNKYIYPIAATLLFLFYLGNITFFIISPELAFQKYYKDYTPVYYAQATVNEAQVLLVHSFDEYNKGNYDAVTENMRTLMEKGELNVRGQIMLAFYDAWKLDFTRKIESSGTSKEDAIWYLALSSLKLNDLEKAQTLFHEIATENYRKAGKAARLERKVKKMILAE